MQLLRQQQLFQAQQKEINRLEQTAKRLMLWGKIYDNPKFSRRGQSIMKRLEKIERVEKPVLERKRMGLELNGWRGSNKMLEVLAVRKSFSLTGDEVDRKDRDEAAHTVLAGLDLLIWRNERVGLVGPNGAGKSLLFRIILGEESPSSGEVRVGPSVNIGYYAQEHETLNPDWTLMRTVRHAAPISESDAVRFLGRFLFQYERCRSPVKTLSGGEQSRLQMALLMLSDANLLLLDEPTNNLDIPSAEVLEDALAEFEGSMLIISHDRYFLDRVVDRIVELDDGVLTEYLGGYSDYQTAKAAMAHRAD
jgi:ATP-binding cassette subfamily F protein 3